MLSIKLTELTQVEIDVDSERIYLKWPSFESGIKPQELEEFANRLCMLAPLHHLLLWIKALKSGRYKQGKYYLVQGDLHCCLGVCVKVAMENGIKVTPISSCADESIFVDGRKWREENNVVELPITYGGFVGSLPTQIREWLGVNIKETPLVKLNDRDGKTFDEIADYLITEYILTRLK